MVTFILIYHKMAKKIMNYQCTRVKMYNVIITVIPGNMFYRYLNGCGVYMCESELINVVGNRFRRQQRSFGPRSTLWRLMERFVSNMRL